VPSPYYTDDRVTVHHGDCLEVLRTLPDCSVDSVVTDPPYDLTAGKQGGTGAASVDLTTPYGRARITAGNSGGFMGKAWDATGVAFDPATWQECLRVLKPGGHMLAFGGTRTWHRLACAIEDAGFEIRDTVASLGGGDSAGLLWMHGQGFPKSLDVSRAIDKAAGVEREVIGPRIRVDGKSPGRDGGMRLGRDEEAGYLPAVVTAPATEDAGRWEGFGTALKPAFEPIVVARGSVAVERRPHPRGDVPAGRHPEGPQSESAVPQGC
jgi:hypothetical protein